MACIACPDLGHGAAGPSGAEEQLLEGPRPRPRLGLAAAPFGLMADASRRIAPQCLAFYSRQGCEQRGRQSHTHCRVGHDHCYEATRAFRNTGEKCHEAGNEGRPAPPRATLISGKSCETSPCIISTATHVRCARASLIRPAFALKYCFWPYFRPINPPRTPRTAHSLLEPKIIWPGLVRPAVIRGPLGPGPPGPSATCPPDPLPRAAPRRAGPRATATTAN